MDADTIIQTKNEVLAELHKDIFLTPKGMMKLVQVIIVICAFALTTSASGTTKLSLQSTKIEALNVDVSASVHTQYSFGSYDYKVEASSSNTNITNKTVDKIDFRDGYVSESQFYVFVGVISLVYVLIVIVCYGWFNKIAKHSQIFEENFTKVDFVATVVLTLLWFLATTLWSSGFSALRAHMNAPNELITLIGKVASDQNMKENDLCAKPSYDCIQNDTWSKLYGSVIFGYLTIILFAANCWYCFKDTEWHAEPEKLGGILRIRTDNDPSSREPHGGGVSGAGVSGSGSGVSGGATTLDDVNLETGTGATIEPGENIYEEKILS